MIKTLVFTIHIELGFLIVPGLHQLYIPSDTLSLLMYKYHFKILQTV